jgi:hypothetical protein
MNKVERPDFNILAGSELTVDQSLELMRRWDNHDALLEALKQTLDALHNETHGKKDSAWITETKEKASSAIANAEK